MGGICSRSSIEDISPSNLPVYQCPDLLLKEDNNFTPLSTREGVEKQLREFSFPEPTSSPSHCESNLDYITDDEIPRLSRALSHKSRSTKSKQVAVAKVSELSSILDTLGSAMTNLNLSSGFVSRVPSKGNKLSILAFEVAITIFKGANLMQSLSEENIKHLKEVVLPSEGVQNLVSTDMDELLRIAAADKREELRVFSANVVCFGNRCKHSQWHNLDRYFEKPVSVRASQKRHLKEEAQAVMQKLMTLVQYTVELYHELRALDRIEQDYRHKLQEEDNTNASQRDESLAILRKELKSQRKHARSLKKKSLWSKILEEVMEKLVDIVLFLHLEIHDAFDVDDDYTQVKRSQTSSQRLGSAGLALHYANIITQIDTLVSHSSSVPPKTRDTLYQGLPPTVKLALRSKLQSFQVKEELTVPQIKAEMEKTLQWLVPIAANTTKIRTRRRAGKTDLIRIETLYHADKEKTDAYILELVVLLHHLISQSRVGSNCGVRSPTESPIHSLTQKTIPWLRHNFNARSPALTVKDHEMLRDVNKRKQTPGISKSQEFDTVKSRVSKHNRLSKSSNHSPSGGSSSPFGGHLTFR